jgi:protein SCO1/2
VSVSLDPVTDTPARLRDFAEKVGSDPQWTWLTGKNSGVMRLLDGLGVYSPDIISHPPVFLVGDGKNKRWKRFNGLPSVEQLQSYIRELQKSRTLLKQNSGYQIIRVHTSEDKDEKARGYFTDLPVITHDGQTLNFYTDLLKNKIVLINLFFSGCEKSCPMVHSKLAKLQNELDDYLGKSVFFISITIDPEPDTPDIMKHYAQSFKPKPGWSFVTGSPENIKTITYRLGQINDDKEAHAPFLMVGDVSNVRWKKFLPNISNEMLARFIKNLAADHSSTHLE